VAGKDGKAHEHKKVPVSEAFAQTIVSGDQVRLVTLPVRCWTTPPCRSSRRHGRTVASLRSWLTISGYIALAAWAGVAALSLFGRRQGEYDGDGSLPTFRRATLLGLVLLVGGCFWRSTPGRAEPIGRCHRSRRQGCGGRDHRRHNRDCQERRGTSHTVRLSEDGQGAVQPSADPYRDLLEQDHPERPTGGPPDCNASATTIRRPGL
jgi:hypothetical protein